MDTSASPQLRHPSGFTLIEISIVIVVIGLLVGGVLVGRDLIEAASLRSEAKAVEEINTAVNAFKLKYNCLPGDCASATSFWAAAATPYWTCATVTTPNVGDETCNGNGDGLVYGRNGSDPNLGHSYFEQSRFFQQLSSAGFIKEKYVGVNGYNGASPILEAGVNVARSKVNPSASVLVRDALLLKDQYGNFYPATIAGGNSFVIGTNTRYISGVLTTGTYSGLGPAYTTRQAIAFDTKFDDGIPGTGLITAAPNNQWNNGIYCTTSGYTNPTVARYNLSYTLDIACPMYGNPNSKSPEFNCVQTLILDTQVRSTRTLCQSPANITSHRSTRSIADFASELQCFELTPAATSRFTATGMRTIQFEHSIDRTA